MIRSLIHFKQELENFVIKYRLYILTYLWKKIYPLYSAYINIKFFY